MGIEQERFVDDVKNGLLCSICRDVLEDPLQAPCEHAFCATCIHGWLVHEHICPEDRQTLNESELKPIFRYMRNDLQRLRIRCINHGNGCDVITPLELLEKHEQQCRFGTALCPFRFRGCTEALQRGGLDQHLLACKFRSNACRHGCGMNVLDSEVESHNCIAELRTEFEIFRSELILKSEEERREVNLKLETQKLQLREQKATIELLKAVTNKLQHELRVLHAVETKRRKDMEKLDMERHELIKLLKLLQNEQSRKQPSQTKGTSIDEVRKSTAQ